MAADLGTGWNVETKSRRDQCNSQLRNARPKVLTASPPCPSFFSLQNLSDGSSSPLESEERRVITARSHLIVAARECSEQKHRGDIASSNFVYPAIG